MDVDPFLSSIKSGSRSLEKTDTPDTLTLTPRTRSIHLTTLSLDAHDEASALVNAAAAAVR